MLVLQSCLLFRHAPTWFRVSRSNSHLLLPLPSHLRESSSLPLRRSFLSLLFSLSHLHSIPALHRVVALQLVSNQSYHLFAAMAPSSIATDDENNDVNEVSGLVRALMLTQNLQDGFIVDIDAIQAHGIGAVDISKLKSNGYYTIASVHAATRRNLLKIKGFSEIKVDKVKDAIAKCQVCSSSHVVMLVQYTDGRCSLLEVGSRLRMSLVSTASVSSGFPRVARLLTLSSEGKYALFYLPGTPIDV
jgi:hypothetical protein